MKLIKEIRENAAVLTLKGEFDSFVCAPFMDEIKGLFKNKVNYIILDLRLVLFINSTAIGTLVKIHKESKAQGGGLVLCRPSNFVHEVLDSLGLLDLFTLADDPEKALAEAGASTDGMDMSGDSSVLLRLPESKETCVARLAALEVEGMILVMEKAPKELTGGIQCDVKFRLPLFKKGHYYEGSVKIDEIKSVKSGVQVACTFEKMKDKDKKSIAQFVEEMKFLRAEARGNS